MLLGLVVPTLAEGAYTTGFLNVRSGPGMKYDVVTVVSPGVPFTVRGHSGHWYKISYAGFTGWVSAHHVAGR
jgi:uncharacterized protein YraI